MLKSAGLQPMTLIKRFFLLLSFFLSVSMSSLWAQRVFEHPDYHYHVTIRNDWVTVNMTQRTLTFKHGTLPATFNVSVRLYPDYPQISTKEEAGAALNEIINRQKIAYFDGWENLIERPGSPLEISTSGVLNSYIAVYSQAILGSDLSVDKHIVAEYYYMQPGMLFILSFKTYMSNWRQLQPEIKSFVDSFWVGMGTRPQFSPVFVEALGWTMSGGNERNTSVVKSTVRLDKAATQVWEAPLSALSGPASAEPRPTSASLIATNRMLVATAKNRLTAYNLENGSLIWEDTLNTPIVKPIAFGNDMIFFVSEDADPNLFAIMPNNGSIVFKQKLTNAYTSAPIYFDQSVYVIDGTSLVKLNTQTTQITWQSEPILEARFRPVMNKDLVYAVTTDNALVALKQSNGIVQWKENLSGPLMTAPVLQDAYMIVAIDSDLILLDPANGKRIREIPEPAFSQLVFSPLVTDKQVFALYKKIPDEPITSVYFLRAYTLETGALLWQKSFSLPASAILTQPSLTQSAVVFTQGLASNKGLASFDRQTGAELLPFGTGASIASPITALHAMDRYFISIQTTSKNISVKVIK